MDQLQIQAVLEELCDTVYFQKPNNTKMVYPCIRFQRDSAQTVHADNNPYRYTKRYLVTVIDPDPNSVIPDKIAALPTSTFNRHYTADNLHHDVFFVYF